MSKSEKPKPTGKARAAAIRDQIEKLSVGADAKADGKKNPPPSSPRDFIQQWMAEHDKKPKEK